MGGEGVGPVAVLSVLMNSNNSKLERMIKFWLKSTIMDGWAASWEQNQHSPAGAVIGTELVHIHF